MIKLFDDALRLIFFPVRWANAVTTWIQNVCSPDDSLKILNTCSPKEGDSLKLRVNMQRIYEGVMNYFADFWITPDKLGEALDEACDRETIIREGGRYKLGIDAAEVAENTYDDQTGTAADILERAEALAETMPKPDKYAKIETDTTVSPVYTEKESADNCIKLIGTSKKAARADHRHALELDCGANISFRPSEDGVGATSSMPDDSNDPDEPLPQDEKYQLNDDKWKPTWRADAAGFSLLVITRIEYDDNQGVHYLYYREMKCSKNGNPVSIGEEKGCVRIMA